MPVPGAGDALFVLSALRMGGSERKVARVATALAAGGTCVGLCALGAPYTLREALAHLPLWTLDRRHRVSPRVARALRRILVQQRPGTVFAVDLFALFYLRWALHGSGLAHPRVVALVNTTTFVRRRDRLFMLGYAPLLRGADLLVFGSSRQREQWLRRYRLAATASCVIHNGVDTARFAGAGAGSVMDARSRLSIPPRRFVIGSVGRLAPEKNQCALVRVLERLCAGGVDAHLLLAGDGPERDALLATAHGRGVAQRVTLAGEMLDVRDALAAMDVFALPSTSVETFSNAALEAMAMGRPVVLTDIGGAREMIEDGAEGFIVPAGDEPALGDALRKLASDPGLVLGMGAAARLRAAREFSFDAMVEAYRAIIGARAARGATSSKADM
jgi:glycosyltransferase involved in cell wall biosynthesis|nr:MAG: hypothetical protein DIU62_13235 [Pseudomonadota bacterium]